MMALIVNHLWQSTVVTAVAGLLVLALRPNGAHVRYFVWLAASAKFLVPFSVLALAGRQLGWRVVPANGRPDPTTLLIDVLGQPFSAGPHTSLGRTGGEVVLAALPLTTVLVVAWATGCAGTPRRMAGSLAQGRGCSATWIACHSWPSDRHDSPARADDGRHETDCGGVVHDVDRTGCVRNHQARVAVAGQHRRAARRWPD